MTTELKVINPATEEQIDLVNCDTDSTIREKLEAARFAQRAWSEKNINFRIEIMSRFSGLLEQHRDALAKTLTLEVGKPLAQSLSELTGARGRIAFFLEQSAKYLATETVFSGPGRTEEIAYEPLGVVGIISAWNYPYLVGVNAFIPALIAGNSVLYKPSEFSTLTGLRITELMHEAGVPREMFAPIVGDGSQGSLLTQAPLDGFFFTGSAGTGRRIRATLADRFIPTGFELGGKDPIYVCEDSDLARVVPAVADGVFYNNGQSCCSVERIYVQESIYERFVEMFVAEVQRYKIGDPLADGTYIGPLTRKAQIEVLSAQVEDALQRGARLMTGGKPISGKGYYFDPTVLADVSHAMRVMRDESFGPIIGIQKVSNDEEAISLMNDTTYGLTAGVYTPNRERALHVLKELNAGSAYWNCCDRVSPHLPWSGRKDSGLGSTLSHIGIRTFARPKAYHLMG